MKFLKKLKSGNFWVSIISAGVIIAEGLFDFEIKTEYLNQILLGLMGLLTLFGIVSDHGSNDTMIVNNTSLDNLDNKQSSNKDEISEVKGISNIKSICDTISLLLNKVSINGDNNTGKQLDKNELSQINNDDNLDQISQDKENECTLNDIMETLENVGKDEILNPIANDKDEIKVVDIDCENIIEKLPFENGPIHNDNDISNIVASSNSVTEISVVNN